MNMEQRPEQNSNRSLLNRTGVLVGGTAAVLAMAACDGDDKGPVRGLELPEATIEEVCDPANRLPVGEYLSTIGRGPIAPISAFGETPLTEEDVKTEYVEKLQGNVPGLALLDAIHAAQGEAPYDPLPIMPNTDKLITEMFVNDETYSATCNDVLETLKSGAEIAEISFFDGGEFFNAYEDGVLLGIDARKITGVENVEGVTVRDENGAIRYIVTSGGQVIVAKTEGNEAGQMTQDSVPESVPVSTTEEVTESSQPTPTETPSGETSEQGETDTNENNQENGGAAEEGAEGDDDGVETGPGSSMPGDDDNEPGSGSGEPGDEQEPSHAGPGTSAPGTSAPGTSAPGTSAPGISAPSGSTTTTTTIFRPTTTTVPSGTTTTTTAPGHTTTTIPRTTTTTIPRTTTTVPHTTTTIPRDTTTTTEPKGEEPPCDPENPFCEVSNSETNGLSGKEGMLLILGTVGMKMLISDTRKRARSILGRK